MRHKVSECGLQREIAVDSAGTSDWHTGEKPHSGTQQQLKEKGISFDGIYSRQLVPEDAEAFDYIIAMDRDNIRDIQAIAPSARARTSLLSDYADGSWTDVPDPWYTKNYGETYMLVSEGCEGLLASLRKRL